VSGCLGEWWNDKLTKNIGDNSVSSRTQESPAKDDKLTVTS